MACKALPSTSFPSTMRSWTIAERSSRLTISEPGTLTPGKGALPDPDLEDAIREYLRTYVLWRGIGQATETFGVSPPHPLEVPETGPHGPCPAPLRPGQRGRQCRGAGSGNMGHPGRRPCARRQASRQTRPGAPSPFPSIGGHAAPAVRHAPGHRGRAVPLRQNPRLNSPRPVEEAGEDGHSGLRVPQPGRSGASPPSSSLPDGEGHRRRGNGRMGTEDLPAGVSGVQAVVPAPWPTGWTPWLRSTAPPLWSPTPTLRESR